MVVNGGIKISLTGLGDVAVWNKLLALEILVSLTSFSGTCKIKVTGRNNLKRGIMNECAQIDVNVEFK